VLGTMATYSSQKEASEGIPQQWQSFLREFPDLKNSSDLYGASPCTNDGKIHYLVGVAGGNHETRLPAESIRLQAGEYAFVLLEDPAQLRKTWIWLLGQWLPNSGRRERNAPEFERYTGISEDGMPIGPVEIWIPLEPRLRVVGASS